MGLDIKPNLEIKIGLDGLIYIIKDSKIYKPVEHYGEVYLKQV